MQNERGNGVDNIFPSLTSTAMQPGMVERPIEDLLQDPLSNYENFPDRGWSCWNDIELSLPNLE
jgi:hypothetical protein